MRIAVIGAGIIGIVSAYALQRRGHEVVVFEREAGPALGTSFANGGQIGPSECGPWAGPDVPWQVIRWLGSPAAPFRWKPQADADHWRFLWAFLKRCTSAAQRDGLERNAPLARLSLNELIRLRSELEEAGHAVDYDRERKGILRIYDSSAALEEAADALGPVRDAGIAAERIGAAAAVALEPALEPLAARGDLAGAIHAPDDESGDAHRFAEGVATAFEAAGGTLRYGEGVLGFAQDGRRIDAVETASGTTPCDTVLLASGTGSAALAAKAGLRLPVYPLKGYSVTIPVAGANGAPRVSITDEGRRMVVSRLGDRVRAAGLADLMGYDLTLEPKRADAVLSGLKDLFPDAGDFSKAEFWTGLRPMMPDGVPLIGRGGALENLWLNTGHGSFGWTLAAGSARLVADLIDGTPPPVKPEAFRLKR